MSSTNRGAIRNEHDFYETPDYSVYSMMEHVGMDLLHHPGPWLEPCVGNGAIIKAIQKWYQENQVTVNGQDFTPTWDAVDIRKEAEYPHQTANFLDWKPKHDHYSLIITNPPFLQAQEIIEKCLTLNGYYPPPTVIMLLRLNFLGAEKRSDFWQRRPIDILDALSERPDFTGDGGDSTEYAWFFWNYDGPQRRKPINVLPKWEGFDKQLRIA